MLKRWWERWPGRFEYEREALEAAGIPYKLDHEALSKGIVKLRLTPTVNGGTLNLVAVFPDVYPYTRFEVYAPNLDLEHHQHPFSKNLCLIGRATWNWRIRDTLAEFIKTRFSDVLKAAWSNDSRVVAELEEHQGEPFGDYYTYLKDAIVLVDSSWSIDPAFRSGELLIGVGEQTGSVLRGAILEVRNVNGSVLAKADPALTLLYPKRIRGRWLRLQKPLREEDPNRFLAALTTENPRLERLLWQPVKGCRVDVIGAVFPEEVGWRQASDGWVFAIRAEELKDPGRRRGRVYLVRAGRAGRADLISRVPELAALQGHRVAVIGLGGVGAPSTLEFARSGVGELRLLDHDIIDPGTIVRWPLGIHAAGLSKAEALSHFIANNYPYTKAITYLTNPRLFAIKSVWQTPVPHRRRCKKPCSTSPTKTAALPTSSPNAGRTACAVRPAGVIKSPT